jgi:hypothetical protein
LESVFDSNHAQESEQIDSSPYTKYTFTIDKLEKLSDFKFVFKSTLFSLEEIQIVITEQTNKKSGIIRIKTTTEKNIWIINENILLINALKKISMCESESVKKDYIRELNSWISSPEYNQKILNIEAIESQSDLQSDICFNTDPEYIKLSSITSQIKSLYKSIQTFGDLHFNHMRQFTMGDLARDISTQTCRSQTGETSVRIISNMTRDDYGCSETSEDNTKCCICMEAPRQVLFSCSHVVTCIDCYKKITVGIQNADRCVGFDFDFTYGICSDNKCPICRQEIISIRELNLELGYKCKTTGCNTMPIIIDANCLSPVYCEPCWSRLICKRKYNKTNIECYCGTPCGITKYIKPKFV